MVILVDFDGTVVRQDRDYEDVVSPLDFMPGAKEGLHALKRANHRLILWSGRANRGMLFNKDLDPTTRLLSDAAWRSSLDINWARYRQMCDFVEKELPGVFDAISDGSEGKPCCDLIIDDKAVKLGYSGGDAHTWFGISTRYGL